MLDRQLSSRLLPWETGFYSSLTPWGGPKVKGLCTLQTDPTGPVTAQSMYEGLGERLQSTQLLHECRTLTWASYGSSLGLSWPPGLTPAPSASSSLSPKFLQPTGASGRAGSRDPRAGLPEGWSQFLDPLVPGLTCCFQDACGQLAKSLVSMAAASSPGSSGEGLAEDPKSLVFTSALPSPAQGQSLIAHGWPEER